MSRQAFPLSRVTRSKEEARATYTRLSRWYDLVEGPFERNCRERGQTLLHVTPGEYVLEIGFGTGQSLVAFARAVGSTGTVCGIDLSEGMCRVAKARLDKAHLSARVALTCGDATRLPYAERSFDAVYMSFTLELFDTPDLPLVLGECARVLRDSGRLGVVALALRDKATAMSRLYAWAHRRFPRLVDCRPIPVRQLVEEAGLQVEAVDARSMWGLLVDIVLARKGA